MKYDLVVIGGGIIGTAIAYAGAGAGFKTLLIEQGVCGQAASANSLRIMHGGLRYLQSFDLPRTIQSLRDQERLLTQYPDIVRPVPCVLRLRRNDAAPKSKPNRSRPVFRLPGKISPAALSVGGLCYNALSALVLGRTRGARVRRFNADSPLIKKGEFVFEWQEALLERPDTLITQICYGIRRYGGTIQEHCRAESVRVFGDGAALNTSQGEIQARLVVNAGGAWVHRLPGALPPPVGLERMGWCKAFNVVLSRNIKPEGCTGVYGDEGRAYFFVSRGTVTAVGTQYLPYEGDPALVSVSDAEVQSFLDQVNRAAPESQLRKADVSEIEVGVLPTARTGGDTVELMGAESIYGSDAYLAVISTKYTTFLSTADRVLALLRKRFARSKTSTAVVN